jgi:VanZ family protein
MLNGGLAFDKKKISIVAVSLFLFGILVEILQGFIPGRSSSFLDLVANSTGIILGLSILYIFGAPIQSLLKHVGLSKK